MFCDQLSNNSMAKDAPDDEDKKHKYPEGASGVTDEEDDVLPDKDAAKGFYAKYEPKEILGR